MSEVKVKYISACFNNSGYASAARNNICALSRVGVNISVESVSFEGFKSDLGKTGDICKSLSSKNNDPIDIQIVHLTPQHFPRMRNEGVYNIGYTTWETSKLPNEWVDLINIMDEVWVPSQHNLKMFKECGISKPIYVFPHTFDTYEAPAGELSSISSLNDEFVFYSIFQWLERKDPVGLIVAYLSEFTSEENVVLILKTYILDPKNTAESAKITNHIKDIKRSMWLKDYPKLMVISNLLDSSQIRSLHARGDCYISLTRCEGFGLPLAEAMIEGNSVITTGYGGQVDFINHEDTGYLVSYTMQPTFGMPWDIYTSEMNWASANILEARAFMRKVYEDQESNKEMGKRAKEYMKSHLSWETIGNAMKSRLEQIKAEK